MKKLREPLLLTNNNKKHLVEIKMRGSGVNVHWSRRPSCATATVMQPFHSPHITSWNLPRRCFWWAILAALTTDTWRFPAPPAPHTPCCPSPSGAETPPPQRRSGWPHGPSSWIRRQTGSRLQRWQNSHRPLLCPTTTYLSYLQKQTRISDGRRVCKVMVTFQI